MDVLLDGPRLPRSSPSLLDKDWFKEKWIGSKKNARDPF
jgi:hypothetical protein